MVGEQSGRPSEDDARVTESLDDAYGTGTPDIELDRRKLLMGAGAIGVGAVLTGIGTARRNRSDDPERGVTVSGDAGVVSAPHPIVAKIGARVLEGGGNAIDAAVAMQFGLSVAAPHAAALGGSGHMLVHAADEGETYVADGRARAPAAASPDRFADSTHDVTESGLAVGTPGLPRLLETVLDRWGTATLADLLEPIAVLAEEGVEIDAELAHAIELDFDRLTPEARDLLGEGGDPLGAGDVLVQNDLAKTLRTIGEEGVDAFYEGAIADDIAATVQDHGGDLTRDDLGAYETTMEDPVASEFNGYRVVAGSPPSSGVTLLQILGLLDSYDLCRCEPAQRYNLALEASRLAYADNGAHLGDDAVSDVPVEALLSDEYLAARRTMITLGESNQDITPGDPDAVRARTDEGVPDHLAPELEWATHFTVADGEGNVVSAASTNSFFFGTGIVVPGRGIFLGNSLLAFDFTPGGPNQVEPGKRPLSAMCPALVFDDGEPLMSAGTVASASTISTTAQILTDMFAHGMDIGTAITRPRVFSTSDPTVWWEDDLSQEIRTDLDEMGYRIAEDPMTIGNVQALVVDQGKYVGATDPRGDGLTIGLPR